MSTKNKNVRHQLRTAVFNAFSEGLDKHDLKAKGLADGKVFSYGTRNQMLDMINDFCKSLPKDIRQPGQIKQEHVQAYLDVKASTVSQKTLDEYRTELKRLGIIIGTDLTVDRVIADRPADEKRGAASVISTDDFNKVLEYAEKNPSGSGACIRLEKELGVRVSDLAYGVHYTGDKLLIRCKNGKWLERDVTPQIRALFDLPEVKKMMDGEKIRAPKDNSINKYLLRVERKLGLEEHSFHDIRRRIAQDKYNSLRESGISRSDALKQVSVWLNHGPNREKMLLQSYINDAW